MKIIKFNENLTPPPTVPNGWVNVKIDDQLFIRLSRYIPALDRLSKNNKHSLRGKIHALSNIETTIKKTDITIQDKISIIVILQYLNEIKQYFNPSSAGFLLEGFIATLIHGRLTKPFSYSDVEVKTHNDLESLNFEAEVENSNVVKNYQIKLYDETKGESLIKVKWNLDKRCDFYVLCLKKHDANGVNIDVCILNGKDVNSKTYIGKFVQKNGREMIIRSKDYFLNSNKDDRDIISNYVKIDKKNSIPYIVIKTSEIKENLRMNLNISNIDDLISKCNKDIKNTLESLFNSLSDLHYNIDSLIIGVDKSKETPDVDKAYTNCKGSLKQLGKEIKKLAGQFKLNL